MVGTFEGPYDMGSMEGCKVGGHDGGILGINVGALLGEWVGSVDGGIVGLLDGDDEGPGEGQYDGGIVDGAALGSIDG